MSTMENKAFNNSICQPRANRTDTAEKDRTALKLPKPIGPDPNAFSSDTKKKRSNDNNDRIHQIKETFMLTDNDLYDFYRFFADMAKKGYHAAPRKSQPPKQHSPRREDALLPDEKAPRRPWTEDDTSSSKKRITLSLSDFFACFELPNGGFYDAIFELIGIRDFHAMTFCEFLDAVCTYSLFTLDDMMKFIFFILDKEREFRVTRCQLLRFIESLHGKKYLTFQHAILPDKEPACDSNPPVSSASSKQTSTIDYTDLKRLCHEYPSMLEPAFRFQNTLRRRVLGEAWWRRKKTQLGNRAQVLAKNRENQRSREERRLLTERRNKIRSALGWIAYYLRRKSRSEVEKEHPLPIVSLDNETGEVCVDWTRVGDDTSQQPQK